VRGAPEVFEFRPQAAEAVIEAMTALTRLQAGWITLQPGVHPDDAPPPRTLFGALFSGTGPPVPVCTWVAPEPKQKPPHPELGVLHKAGPKAVRTLEEAAVPVPEHWVVLADHPRRGLVIAIHPESAHVDVLAWVVRAAEELTRVPLTGTWQASVHGRT
jgi:hypothetical protein